MLYQEQFAIFGHVPIVRLPQKEENPEGGLIRALSLPGV
jgi:hypothetical protein